MPFGRIHDPIGRGALRALAISEHAKDEGRVREFVLACSRAIWAEATDVSQDGPLRSVCERAGLDWEGCRAALDDGVIRARVEGNTEALAALGHWGVPVFHVDGELFWGQDRVEDVAALLASRAAAARS
jgi:2-hydroxychromene-2-carboxylate isomerase